MTIIKHIGCTNLPSNPWNELSSAYELMDQYNSADDLVICLDNFWETTLTKSVEKISQFVKAIKQKNKHWRIFLIANSCDSFCDDKVQTIGLDDVLYIDFFLYRVYKEIIIHKKSSISHADAPPSYDKQKFLFLTGKSHKPNRIGLLKKFVDNKLMDRAEWSFFYFVENTKYNLRVRAQLSELTDSEFEEFVKKWSRNPDNINIKATVTVDGYEYNGIPYDVGLYTKTDFSVISETTFGNTQHPWITEKVWIPILNKHPFIIAGDTNILTKLEKLGFETFKDFLKIPEYDQIVDESERLDAVVSNTEHFLSELNKNANMINHCVDKNLKVLAKLYFHNNEKILNFMIKHQLTEFSIDEIVPTKGRGDSHIANEIQDQLFVKFYNNIKDPAWPEVSSSLDFFKLPIHIQQECINDFGYTPPKQ